MRKHLFTSPPSAAFPGDTCPTVRLQLQQQRAEKILAPARQTPLPLPPPRQVPAPTGGPAPPGTSASAQRPSSAYPGRPGSAQAGRPAAGVPAAAAAATAAAALPGTRRPAGPARARSPSRPGSTRLPRRPRRAGASRAGPCAPAPPARLPAGPGASPPAEPWGRFTHPGRCLAPHRAGEPKLRRPAPHRASPAMARAPEGAGRRDLLARPAVPRRAPGAAASPAQGPGPHGAAARAGRDSHGAGAARPGRRGWDGRRPGPPPRSRSCRPRGRGCEEPRLAASGRTRDPPSYRRPRPPRPALLAAGSRGLGFRLRVRLTGRECYCSSKQRLIDKEST